MIQVTDYLQIVLKNTQAANLMTNAFRAAIRQLETNARAYPVYVQLKNGVGIRRINVRRYVVFYFVVNDRVDVIHVLHQSQDILRRIEW